MTGAMAVLMTLTTLSLGWTSIMAQPQVSASDGSVVPLLLQKQSDQGTNLQLMTITKSGESYQAELSQISGTNLEDSNLAYRFSSKQTATSKPYVELSRVVGDLVSGNGAAELNFLKEKLIG
jgi:hypothetical protein